MLASANIRMLTQHAITAHTNARITMAGLIKAATGNHLLGQHLQGTGTLYRLQHRTAEEEQEAGQLSQAIAADKPPLVVPWCYLA